MIKIAGPWEKHHQELNKYIRPTMYAHYAGSIVITSLGDSSVYMCFGNRHPAGIGYIGMVHSLEEAKQMIDKELIYNGYSLIDDLNQFNRLKNLS